MRIGVAGLNGAGKTEVVRFFERRSFYTVSLSDVIREELSAQGLEPTRENMIRCGRELRDRGGPGALAQRAIASLPSDRHHVIDSIRHPAEVELLRDAGAFTLLWVEADPHVRFERSRDRGRAGDGDTFERFQELEARELQSDDASGQQLLAVAALANETVRNDAAREELEQQLESLLRGSLLFRDRPGWDEYFMNLATVVASRSNCVKRMVGAIVVADRRVISTGYNGTPRGTRNCNEGGCPRCNGGAETGTRLDECLCSHAEENAITQAAYHGVSVRGATIYTTFSPCLICTKMIINAGIREVIYGTSLPLEEVSSSLLREAGVKVRGVAADR
jgi:dCMP deaminase